MPTSRFSSPGKTIRGDTLTPAAWHVTIDAEVGYAAGQRRPGRPAPAREGCCRPPSGPPGTGTRRRATRRGACCPCSAGLAQDRGGLPEAGPLAPQPERDAARRRRPAAGRRSRSRPPARAVPVASRLDAQRAGHVDGRRCGHADSLRRVLDGHGHAQAPEPPPASVSATVRATCLPVRSRPNEMPDGAAKTSGSFAVGSWISPPPSRVDGHLPLQRVEHGLGGQLERRLDLRDASSPDGAAGAARRRRRRAGPPCSSR